MPRIGFTGTNWTGKTETIRRFLEIHNNSLVTLISLSDFVAECPFPMKKEQTLDGSRWMVEHIIQAMNRPYANLQIFDRTPLDILAFTLYAQNRTNTYVPELVQIILELILKFDFVFYLRPSDQWPVNVKIIPKEVIFARKIDRYIREALEQTPMSVTELPWDMNERCCVVSECLSNVSQLK